MVMSDLLPDVLREVVPVDPVIRIRVVAGEGGDAERRVDRTLVARSECTYRCPTAEVAAACIEALRESGERLRQRPEELSLWSWASTYFKPETGGSARRGDLILGVAWYDEDFYRERRGIWLSRLRRKIYEQLNIPETDITVRHWRPDLEAGPADSGSAHLSQDHRFDSQT